MIIDGCARVSPTSYGSTEGYLEQLQEAGIHGGVIAAGGMMDVRWMDAYIKGRIKPDPVPKNDYVEEAINESPELHGLVALDPRDPRATEILEQHQERGFRGLYVSPFIHGFLYSDDGVASLASLCGERGMPFYSHVGYRPGANTADYAELARRFPRTNFVLTHMGAAPSDGEATNAATELSNFFVETSCGNYLHILETVNKAGASKVIFGSEYPLSHPTVELQKILLLPISERDRDKILGENIRELLHLEEAPGDI